MTKDNLQIYETLSHEIVTMHLIPGTMLKEVEVARQFNVSRTPIRDVFKKLEYDKLLVIHSQRGSYVSKINLDGITDIMYIRDQVEYAVLSELMQIITPGDIVKLRLIVNDQIALLSQKDGEDNATRIAARFFELDNIFHEHIYKRAGKETVLEIINSYSPSFSRYRFLTFMRDRSEVASLCSLHGQIVDCLEHKDEADLRDIVQKHNFSGLNGIESVRRKHPDFFE